MWTRSELKSRAKQALKGTFWISVLVVILFLILTGGENSNLTLKLGEDATREMEVGTGIFGYNFDTDSLQEIVALPLTAFMVLFGALAGLVSILWSIFISMPLNMGMSKYFLTNRRNKGENTPLNLFFPFRSGYYMNVVVVTFMQTLFIFLHFLLLIIPGIIKIFAYYMVPWILADDPSISYKDALALSSEMTKGHKMDIFVLELSFIGWYLLTFLSLGLLAPLVTTYRYATIAELYEHLKQGKIQPETSPLYF
ncbi:DUF975 family protein [Proteiniclasticum sp.]|uniref:DUF975 family protein n=1 Tax=Proteiniclasticum sp. TaxID=2053595 RepID=UPI002897A859|nr:DUF975 family protein [Proteiniclasticum sp.]